MPTPKWELTIEGELTGKANSRQLVPVRGRYIPVLSKKARRFEKDAKAQLAAQWHDDPIEDDLVIEVHVWYKNWQNDLDATLLFDVLERCGVVKNDRQFKEQHLYHYLDKERPRMTIAMQPRVV